MPTTDELLKVLGELCKQHNWQLIIRSSISGLDVRWEARINRTWRGEDLTNATHRRQRTTFCQDLDINRALNRLYNKVK